MEVKSTENADGKLLITFALFTYNQERFIAEAIRGALSQTYSPLEIIISDDCSTDSTFAVIEKEVAGYAGRHSIRVNRNERNLGFAAHINKVMEMAKGQLIVGAAGDDVSLPERVSRTYAAFHDSNESVLSVYSNAIEINERGERGNLHIVPPDPEHLTLEWMSKRGGGVHGCSHAWHRRVFDTFGSLDAAVVREDVVIPFRSALLGKVKFINEPLVLYRLHGNNIHYRKSDKNVADLYANLLKLAEGNIAIFRNRLKDLDAVNHLNLDGLLPLFPKLMVEAERNLREMQTKIKCWFRRVFTGEFL